MRARSGGLGIVGVIVAVLVVLFVLGRLPAGEVCRSRLSNLGKQWTRQRRTQMADVKKVARDIETTTKKTVRGLDGTSPADQVGNAGDEIRKDLGNAGDAIRRETAPKPKT